MPYLVHANNPEKTLLASSDEISIESDNWYFEPEQVDMTYLVKTDKTWACPYRGIGYWYNLEAPNLKINNVAWCYPEAGDSYANIRGRIGFWGRDTAASLATSPTYENLPQE